MGESSGPSKKEHRPERWDGDTSEPEHQVHPGEDGEAEEPEPQEQKHLFVDNVEGENTEAVELLLAGGRAHRVERATGDCGEHSAHRVWKITPRDLVVTQVLHKASAKEKVCEVDVADHYD